jgi:hypothetical protein
MIRSDHRDVWDHAPFPEAPGVWGYLMNIDSTLGTRDPSRNLTRPTGGCTPGAASGRFTASDAVGTSRNAVTGAPFSGSRVCTRVWRCQSC